MADFRGIYSRGYLPHIDAPESAQFITWRLRDSLPAPLWSNVLAETESLDESLRVVERRKRCEAMLDEGHGEALLRQPLAAIAVVDSLLFGNGSRYALHAFAVMPNHVHCVLTLAPGEHMETVMRTIKSFCAREINRVLGRSVPLWQREYYDRMIRDGEHFMRTIAYVEHNPVKAGLSYSAESYPYCSAWPKHAERLRGG